MFPPSGQVVDDVKFQKKQISLLSDPIINHYQDLTPKSLVKRSITNIWDKCKCDIRESLIFLSSTTNFQR